MMKIPSSIRRPFRPATCAYIGIVICLLVATNLSSQAQAADTAHGYRQDLAITFMADRTNPVHFPNQWLTGGSAELGVNMWHGFGVAAKVEGMTASSLGNQGVPLNMIVTTFGPRYRLTHVLRTGHEISVYGEGLVGEADGFKSLFYSPTGVIDSSNALAVQAGGGLDFNITSRFGVRVLEADWMRTQFPNGGTNVQNHLELGTGLFLRF